MLAKITQTYSGSQFGGKTKFDLRSNLKIGPECQARLLLSSTNEARIGSQSAGTGHIYQGLKMIEKTIFKKIIDGEIPANIVLETDDCLAFHDVAPQAPVHVLVIPKKEVLNVAGLADEDQDLAGKLLMMVRDVARKLELGTGYRVVANCGSDGGQSVDHLHFHVLGGRAMKWPPG